MQSENPKPQAENAQMYMDVGIKLGLVATIAWMSLKVFTPFIQLMVWALILAVGLYPLQQWLAARLGGRSGRASVVLVLFLILMIGVPFGLMSTSFAEHVQQLHRSFEANTLNIEPPKPSVADWPLVGEKIYRAWDEAARNLPVFVKENKVALEKFAKSSFSMAANSALAVLAFLASLVIAGIMMAYGERGGAAMLKIFCRLAGSERGPRLWKLSTATVRSVASGVIGVAVIQALLLGCLLFLAGVPAAGVISLVILFLGILQLPAAIVVIPAIIYMWSSLDASTTHHIVYTILLILGGLADNVLKPLLLGRGVEAPMPVILIGALGGMVAAGILGLFVGAVVLAVAYQIFMEWVDEASTEQPVENAPSTDSTTSPTRQ